jgi:hypothetical protein
MLSRQHEIRIKVSEEEFNIISQNADILDMNVASYIRQVAQNPKITIFDYASIRHHTQRIGEIVNTINQLIFTIELNNDYQPKEIEGIAEYIKEIWETENKLLREVRNQWEKAYKQGRSGK